MSSDLQDEWNRAASAGRARTRKRLLRSAAIVSACVLDLCLPEAKAREILESQQGSFGR